MNVPRFNRIAVMTGSLCIALVSVRAAEHRGLGSPCDWLAGKPGALHADTDHPWIQNVTFNTRFHWQYAWLDGSSESTADRQDFHYQNRGEVRRFYFGPTIRFLDAFTLKAEANMVADDKPANQGRDWGYDSMFELYLTADITRLANLPALDALRLSYGKYEQRFTEEHMTSSRDILTIERSMLDAYLLPGVPLPANPTGLWIEAQKLCHTLAGGLFSTDSGTELSNWDDGLVYWITWRQDHSERIAMDRAETSFNFVWNDTRPGQEQAVNYNWAAIAWGHLADGPWSIGCSLIHGDNRSDQVDLGGHFSGIDILPAWWLVPDRLQLALRGEAAFSSSAEGLRLASRYARIAGDAANENIPALASGRGDRHYSFYAGLNWYLCGSHAKIMTGIEWERMENSATRQTIYDGGTTWVAWRTFF